MEVIYRKITELNSVFSIFMFDDTRGFTHQRPTGAARGVSPLQPEVSDLPLRRRQEHVAAAALGALPGPGPIGAHGHAPRIGSVGLE